MSNNCVFAIASITILLKRLLNNEIIRQFAHAPLGDVAVTALPPDRIHLGTEERAQVNLYLYHVTPNSLRQFANGQTPLALNLHYLLAAYGEKELQAEALLGCAAQLFHENPILTPEKLRSLLTSSQDSGNGEALQDIVASASFINTMPSIKIQPEFLNIDEQARLWSSWQAHARPALTYQISMVLLGEAERSEVSR